MVLERYKKCMKRKTSYHNESICEMTARYVLQPSRKQGNVFFQKS